MFLTRFIIAYNKKNFYTKKNKLIKQYKKNIQQLQ